MKKVFKKATSLLMVVTMLMTMIGFTTIAKAETVSGDGWSFDTTTATLTVTKDTWMMMNPNTWSNSIDATGVNIRNVVFAEGVKTVGVSLFDAKHKTKVLGNCEKTIESVSFPSTVATIGSEAFRGQTSLASITFAEPAAGVELTIGNTAFCDISLAYNFVIPKNTVGLGNQVFRSNTATTTATSGQTRIVIPSSVKTVGNLLAYGKNYMKGLVFQSGENNPALPNLFINNQAYNYLVLPSNVKITAGTAIGIKKTTAIITHKGSDADKYAKANGNTAIYYIPDGVTVTDAGQYGNTVYWVWDETTKTLHFVGNGACLNGSAIWGSTTVPEWESYSAVVESAVFHEGITLVNQNILRPNIGTSSALASLPTYATRGTALKSVTFPSTCTAIKTMAFKDSAVETVNFAEGLETIEGQAFYGTKIKAVTIPASVTTIGDQAFTGAAWNKGYIKTVNFAEGSKLTTIGNYAFRWNPINNHIVIPASVTSIGTNAFAKGGIDTLKAVTFEGALPAGVKLGDIFSGRNVTAYYPEYADDSWEAVTEADRTSTSGDNTCIVSLVEKALDADLTVTDEGVATVSYKNYSSSAIAGKMFVAAYDENDRFITVVTPVDASIAAATTAPVKGSQSFNITADNASYYKAFVWNNMTDIMPQMDAVDSRD